MNDHDVIESVREAVLRAGSQLALSNQTGTSHTAINNILNGRSKVDNITFGTLRRLLPNLRIEAFHENPDDSIESQLMTLVRLLKPNDKVLLLGLLANNFPYVFKSVGMKRGAQGFAFKTETEPDSRRPRVSR